MMDYYKTLEVAPSASYDDIKKSYRRLALKYHPDKNSGNFESHRLFTEINQAYRILSSEESRKRYDSTYRIRMRPVTPQVFLQKFRDIRNFVSSRGKSKISQAALLRALTNLLSDSNIEYLSSKSNEDINQRIVEEVLKCCDFLPSADVEKVTDRLLLLSGSNKKITQKIHTYIENHKTFKESFIEALATITHKVTTFFN